MGIASVTMLVREESALGYGVLRRRFGGSVSRCTTTRSEREPLLSKDSATSFFATPVVPPEPRGLLAHPAEPLPLDGQHGTDAHPTVIHVTHEAPPAFEKLLADELARRGARTGPEIPQTYRSNVHGAPSPYLGAYVGSGQWPRLAFVSVHPSAENAAAREVRVHDGAPPPGNFVFPATSIRPLSPADRDHLVRLTESAIEAVVAVPQTKLRSSNV